MAKRDRGTHIQVEVPRDLHRALKAAAKADCRTMASMIRKILADWAAKREET